MKRSTWFWVLVLLWAASVSGANTKAKVAASRSRAGGTAAAVACGAFIACATPPSIYNAALWSNPAPAYASYVYQPPSRAPSNDQPLRYITPATLVSGGEETVKAAFDEIKKAALVSRGMHPSIIQSNLTLTLTLTLINHVQPSNIDTFVAIAAAETIAGVVGGISSRKVADALKDKKRDNLSTKALSSGAFFGTRGFSRFVLSCLALANICFK